jgi:hypothetical protein
MAEQKEDQKVFSTCLEDNPFAEMMQKMSGQQGIGSLCAERMKSMMKNCCGIKEELKKTKGEECHGRDK